jgi:hypothetical protein
MDSEGYGSGLIEVLSWQFAEGTEENHEKSQDSRCPGSDSNPEPTELMSGTAPLVRPVWCSTFYETRRFITLFTKVQHWILS